MRTLAAATPVGVVVIHEAEGAITRLGWAEAPCTTTAQPASSPLLREAARQLSQYFDGSREAFELPLRVDGSAFQQAVCAEIAAIPFGQTRTYGEIAKRLDCAAQPVGAACGGNPIPLFIPCHRVLGANSLGGFSGGAGVETKVALLRHEGAAGLLI